MAILQLNHLQTDAEHHFLWQIHATRKKDLRGDILCAQNTENEAKQLVGALNVKQAWRVF
jgi:predicted negative regulator of RcsB-dependent stress response